MDRPAGTTAAPEQALLALRDEQVVGFLDSPVAQARVAPDGRVLAVNDALVRLLGLPRDALVGQDGTALFAEHERDSMRDNLRRLISGEAHYLRRTRQLVHGTEERVLVLTSVAVTDARGGRLLAMSVEDVTDLSRAQAALQSSAERFGAVTRSLPMIVFTFDAQGVCTSSRGAALTALGLADDQLVGTSLLEMYADAPEVVAALAGTLAGREGYVLRELDGRWWEGHYSPQRTADGRIDGGVGIALDVTDRVQAQREAVRSSALVASLLRHAYDVAIVVGEDGLISWASPASPEHLGWTAEQLVGRPATDFNPPEDVAEVRAAWLRVADRPGATTTVQLRVRCSDGRLLWSEQHYTNLLHDPDVRGVVVNIRDVTDRRRAERELQRLALRDGLTGLANRALLLDRTAQALAAEARTGARTGLVVLDVVGMRALDAEHGQAGGDVLLRTLAERLEQVARSTDSVARTGGDELCVLLEGLASVEDLRSRVAALLQVADEPVRLGDRSIAVRLQAGSAMSPAVDAGSLLVAAERAVPHDRPERARVAPGSVPGAPGADELAQAVALGQLVLHFQPVVRLHDGGVVGAEALVRWEHPERGLVPPAEFVPLAEASGLVVELGAWVLREAMAAQARWRAAGHAVRVGVNLSPVQLGVEGLARTVREAVARAGARPQDLVLEVTESALMDAAGAGELLGRLADEGYGLALDDFGTGYSSLTYLKRFPVQALKVDRSFVAGLGRDADDDAIVASVASLGRAVGLGVVAEGVETPEQRDALRALGVQQGQGYLWSRALPCDELLTWLDARRPASPAVLPPPPAAGRPAVLTGSDEERILALQAEGASLHTIAAALNAEGRRTAAGVRWTPQTVAKVVAGLAQPV